MTVHRIEHGLIHHTDLDLSICPHLLEEVWVVLRVKPVTLAGYELPISHTDLDPDLDSH